MIKTFPILFNEEKRKKWKIWVQKDEENVNVCIYRTDCLISKNFEKKPSIRKVDPKGKKTPVEQAIFEAKKYWAKKVEGNFFPKKEDEEGQQMYKELLELKNKQGGSTRGLDKPLLEKEESSTSVENSKETNTFVQDVKSIQPMLAHEYNDKKKRVIWEEGEASKLSKKLGAKFRTDYFDASNGAFVQPKVDGIRNVSFIDRKTNSIVCYSRNSKQFMFLNDQRNEIFQFLNHWYEKTNQDVILDGEWYVHEPTVNGEKLRYNKNFNFISSCCKTNLKNPNKNEKLIQYYLFDIIDATKSQTERYKLLKDMIASYSKIKPLKFVVSCNIDVVSSEEELKLFHNKYYEQGYEGIILRDPNAKYQMKRSLSLLKYKNFYDAEFLIIGAESAKGTREGAVIWVCQTEGGEKFNCTMKDISTEEAKSYYENYVDYIGEKLTIKYQDLGENGVPRFPVGISIRNYEN